MCYKRCSFTRTLKALATPVRYSEQALRRWLACKALRREGVVLPAPTKPKEQAKLALYKRRNETLCATGSYRYQRFGLGASYPYGLALVAFQSVLAQMLLHRQVQLCFKSVLLLPALGKSLKYAVKRPLQYGHACFWQFTEKCYSTKLPCEGNIAMVKALALSGIYKQGIKEK
ncbi:hypothetical protein NPIL_295471 [Nephila pilipes]|uniref:Uncharacterized protein n=1 Tax=Nephila pilipes TaxID=299642 RepID=A0A8X6R4C2_NEPPI|nr:hypothetical protein NPIL_295471 [Nephila pilipes]